MLGWSLGFTVLFGLPLGIVLYLTGQPQLLHAPRLYRLLSLCVNVLRSLPFIILLIVMIPVTTLITGTSLGVGHHSAAGGGLRAFLRPAGGKRPARGGSRSGGGQLVDGRQYRAADLAHPAARVAAGLIAAVTVTAILLVDYTSMAGVIGGGGLGDLAIRFGYQRFQTDVMVVTVLLLIALVQILQMSGDRLVRYMSRK
jgi:D-methionine transport system permease protein